MADRFYGATMDITAARAAFNLPYFNHFIFQVFGYGNGNFKLSCNAVRVDNSNPANVKRYYVRQTLGLPINPPWSNPSTNIPFTFCNLIMDKAMFLALTPTNVISTEITILPKGLVSNPSPDYHYLVYQAETTVPDALTTVKAPLNPSPPYHPN